MMLDGNAWTSVSVRVHRMILGDLAQIHIVRLLIPPRIRGPVIFHYNQSNSKRKCGGRPQNRGAISIQYGRPFLALPPPAIPATILPKMRGAMMTLIRLREDRPKERGPLSRTPAQGPPEQNTEYQAKQDLFGQGTNGTIFLRDAVIDYLHCGRTEGSPFFF
jgi:hypothetical protein